MAIKNYKPTTPSRRNMSVTDYSGLSKVAPEKSLLAPKQKTSGRNSYGRITVRHRGGGNRQKYRIIDFPLSNCSVMLPDCSDKSIRQPTSRSIQDTGQFCLTVYSPAAVSFQSWFSNSTTPINGRFLYFCA